MSSSSLWNNITVFISSSRCTTDVMYLVWLTAGELSCIGLLSRSGTHLFVQQKPPLRSFQQAQLSANCYDCGHSYFIFLYHCYTDILKYIKWLFPVLLILIWHYFYMDSHIYMLWLFMWLFLIRYSCITVTGIFFEYSTWSFPVLLKLIWHSCYLDIRITGLRCAKISDTRSKVPHHICGRGHNPMSYGSHASCYPITCY